MKTYELAKNCQQVDRCSNVAAIFNGGPFVVRVHESLEQCVKGTPHRYYLSVNLKFRPIDALRDFGWSGCTKAEATKDAKALGAKLAAQHNAAVAAKAATGMVGQKILVERQEKALANSLARYSAEII